MKKIKTFLICLGILLVTTEIKSQVWNKIAELPHGAAILDMAVDNSNIIYALTSANDIYYTSTNALSWTKMPGTDIFFGIRDIELDKTSNVLYVSTELQGIHWTPNKGLSWQNHPIYTNTITGFNAEINSTVRKPNSNIIICNDPEIGYSQIHRSTNAGLNWVTTFETFEIAYTLKYLANNTLLAGTELGIYKSLNDGVSWNPSNIGMVNFTVKSILEKNTISKIFAAADLNINTQDTTGCGVFVSNDGGASWTKTSAGMTDCRINCLTMDNSGNLYATYPGGVYRSTNNGVTWSAINSGLGQNNEYATITSNNSGLFAGSKRSGVAFSTMPVNNWTFRNSGMRVKTIGHMLLSNTGTIYTADQYMTTGVYTYTNPNWSSMNNGLPLSGCEQLVEDNNGTLYVSVAGLTSCLYKSLNQGISWLPITTMPIPANVYYVSAPVLKIDNNNNIYAVQKASPSFNSPISLPDRLFRSTDNGTSWTLLFVADSNSAGIFDVDLAIDSTIFIATGNNSIINPPQTDYLYSSDWGNSFSPLPNSISTPFAINDLVIAPNDSLYFLQDNILFKRSLGQWVQLMSNTWDSDPQQHPTNLYIDNLNKLYVTSRFEGVFYSTDNGTTWSNITTGLPPILYLPNTPPIHIYDIQFDGNNIPYALSTDIDAVNTGGIYKFANSVITALKTSGVDNLIVNVYPNPVTNACTVSLNIKANEHFDLQIYNASGKLLKTFNRNESNNNQVTVDMSMYTAGLYFVKTITTNQTSVTKIVKE